MKGKNLFCRNCGYQGPPKRMVRGSFAVELLLYLFFIVPGICYTAWRLSNKYTACPQCGEPNMIPLESPVARRMIQDMH